MARNERAGKARRTGVPWHDIEIKFLEWELKSEYTLNDICLNHQRTSGDVQRQIRKIE